MSSLRDKAHGRQCQIRLPGCTHSREETVLAHYRGPATGMGRKEIDLFGAWACSSCHDLVDGRKRPPVGWTTLDVALAFHEGILRTQEILVDEGAIKI